MFTLKLVFEAFNVLVEQIEVERKAVRIGKTQVASYGKVKVPKGRSASSTLVPEDLITS